MARAHLRFVVQDREGNAIQNATVYAYRAGTTTAPYGTMYTAETGGTTQSNPITSNSTGTVETWLDTAQLVDLKVTDNSDAAYIAGTGTLSSWTDFTVEDISVGGGAASDVAGSATSPVGFTVESSTVGVLPFAIQVNNGDGNGTMQVFSVENNNPGPIDINVRNSTMAIGSIDAAEQKFGIGPLQFLAKSGSTGNFIQMYYPGEYSGTPATPCFSVNNAGTLKLYSGGLAGTAVDLRARTESTSRMSIDEFGAHAWGPGASAATDTTLSRSAANVLSLGSNDAIKTGAAVHASLPAATGYAAGSQFYCTTDKQPLWSDGTSWYEADGTAH